MVEYNDLLNEYLVAIKNGDETKFQDLLRLTHDQLINVAKIYLLDKSEATAVVRDVYLKIHLYADRYKPSENPKAYLWQIVKRRAFDYNKQFRKQRSVNIDDIPIFDKIDHFEIADTRIDVNSALKRIDQIDALIVRWTFEEDKTQDEIAQRLGISKSAVSQRLTKAKKKLSKYIK